MSDEVFNYMRQLKEFNYERIYLHPEVERKSHKAANVVELLFHELDRVYNSSEYGKDSSFVQVLIKEAPVMETFFHFIKNTNYTSDTPSWRIVTDYVAGMTDLFAERTFMQLFMPTPVI
jgi:dGTPase